MSMEDSRNGRGNAGPFCTTRLVRRRKVLPWMKTDVSSLVDPSRKRKASLLVTRSPSAVWKRSPSASTLPSSVLNERNPCTSPSRSRTATASAEAIAAFSSREAALSAAYIFINIRLAPGHLETAIDVPGADAAGAAYLQVPAAERPVHV